MTRRSGARPRSKDQPDDATLLTRCLDGDEDAWRTVVARHGRLVWGIARRVGLGEEDVADVYQTVWRIAVQDLHRIRRADRLRSWLARTAHLQALRVVRGYCIARRHLDLLEPEDVLHETPEQALSAVEERLRVAAGLEHIGDRCRDLLRLLYYADPRPSYAQISRRLGMPVGSIGPTRARCLERLEKHLEPEGRDDPQTDA